jgi:lipid A 3-O-deacylase
MFRLDLSRILLFVFVVFFSSLGFAEDTLPANFGKGTWEVGLWAGGGTALWGASENPRLWTAGIRIGKVISKERGEGNWRGNLEAAVELFPAYLLLEDKNVSGISLTPLLIKWNFTSRPKVIPFFELGGGVLVTNEEVPVGTTKFNFTPQAAFGIHFLNSHKHSVSVLFKYLHISNGGLATPNPGINSVELIVGFEWIR